jgi:hypothetical protein
MGLSMTVIVASDRELDEFRTNVRALNAIEDPPMRESHPSSWLSNEWRTLNDLLTDGGRRTDGARDALIRGDLSYPAATDTTHALRSETARLLAQTLNAITPTLVREYIERKWARPGGRPRDASILGRWIPSPAALDQLTSETSLYLDHLRSIANRAAEAGCGLVFVRFEDW